ncbi:MAG: hypothetical protein ACTS73_09165 [Arsenophonus sp. NEOnobi-MAG3]
MGQHAELRLVNWLLIPLIHNSYFPQETIQTGIDDIEITVPKEVTRKDLQKRQQNMLQQLVALSPYLFEACIKSKNCYTNSRPIPKRRIHR